MPIGICPVLVPAFDGDAARFSLPGITATLRRRHPVASMGPCFPGRRQPAHCIPLPHTRGRGESDSVYGLAGASVPPHTGERGRTGCRCCTEASAPPHVRRGGSARLERAWCRLRRRAPGERRGSSQLPLAPAPISLRRDPSPWPHRALLIPVWKVSPFWLIYGQSKQHKYPEP